MLRYLASGLRRFGDTPMPTHRRLNWEFLAVLRGKCAPTIDSAKRLEPVADTLWLFPPQTPHGWIGEPANPCRVVVIHFSSVPAALEEAVRERGFLVHQLSGGDKQLLAELSRSLKPHYWDPVQASEIHTTKALMELSLLFLDHAASTRIGQRGQKTKKVQTFEDWVREHLPECPSIAGGARAVGLSPSQLRRICLAVRGTGPTEILQRLRIERAMELMAKKDAKLTTVAAECGFSSATNFCRAFKAAAGTTPGTWRNEIYFQYQKPRAKIGADHRQHGRRRAAL